MQYKVKTDLSFTLHVCCFIGPEVHHNAKSVYIYMGIIKDVEITWTRRWLLQIQKIRNYPDTCNGISRLFKFKKQDWKIGKYQIIIYKQIYCRKTSIMSTLLILFKLFDIISAADALVVLNQQEKSFIRALLTNITIVKADEKLLTKANITQGPWFKSALGNLDCYQTCWKTCSPKLVINR